MNRDDRSIDRRTFLATGGAAAAALLLKTEARAHAPPPARAAKRCYAIVGTSKHGSSM